MCLYICSRLKQIVDLKLRKALFVIQQEAKYLLVPTEIRVWCKCFFYLLWIRYPKKKNHPKSSRNMLCVSVVVCSSKPVLLQSLYTNRAVYKVLLLPFIDGETLKPSNQTWMTHSAQHRKINVLHMFCKNQTVAVKYSCQFINVASFSQWRESVSP